MVSLARSLIDSKRCFDLLPFSTACISKERPHTFFSSFMKSFKLQLCNVFFFCQGLPQHSTPAYRSSAKPRPSVAYTPEAPGQSRVNEVNKATLAQLRMLQLSLPRRPAPLLEARAPGEARRSTRSERVHVASSAASQAVARTARRSLFQTSIAEE